MNDNLIFLVIIVSLGIMVLLCGFFVLFHKSQVKIAEQNRLWQEEKLHHHQDLIRTSVASQDIERKRIGQDLHDGIGTSLSILRLSIEHFELLHPPTDANLTGFLDDCKMKIDSVIQSCRKISHALSPEILTINTLCESLEELMNSLFLSEGVILKIDGESRTSLDAMDEEAAINLYRIVEELLNNTIRHAAATRVVLHCFFSAGRIQLHYRDNGKGYDQKKSKTGHGLRHIESRLLVLKGRYESLTSSDGPGYQIRFSIPATVFSY